MADDLVRLNVGGRKFMTTKATLGRYPDSMLGAMFNGHMPTAQDEEGNYFIDRDGQMFSYILNFLRSSHLALPNDFNNIEALTTEADFYQIKPLIELLGQMQLKISRQSQSNRYIEVIEVRVGSTATMPTNNSRVKTIISGCKAIIHALPSHLIGDSERLREALNERLQNTKDTDYTELEIFGSNARIRMAEYLSSQGWALQEGSFSSSSAFDKRSGCLSLEHSYRDRWFLPSKA